VAAVLIWRSPTAVAESLQRRDDIDRPVGLALWERYNRAALDDLVGIDTYVARYEDLLEDPEGSLGAMAGWLDSLPGFAGQVSTASTRQAAATLHSGTSSPIHADERILLEEQEKLEGVLRNLHGGHRPLENLDIGTESPWSTALLRSRRSYRSRQLDIDEQRHAAEITKAEAFTQAATDLADYWERTTHSMEASTSWRATRWLRTLGSMRDKR
jgi:hypothetical protein